jgi:Mn-dependent DtxR family transcriptional regulator
MKNEKLTGDEYDALEFIRRDLRGDRRTSAINACIGRNAKRLAGLKLVQYAKNGSLSLSAKGEEVLFLRRCVEALRALEQDPASALDEDVVQFLKRKSHIAARESGGYELTDRGRESLADISAQEPKR